MTMTGYIPTDDDIATMVRKLEKEDPENANPTYARKYLIRTKLMYRALGKVGEELLHKEMESFKTDSAGTQ